jgi:hypothetical protein
VRISVSSVRALRALYTPACVGVHTGSGEVRFWEIALLPENLNLFLDSVFTVRV